MAFESAAQAISSNPHDALYYVDDSKKIAAIKEQQKGKKGYYIGSNSRDPKNLVTIQLFNESGIDVGAPIDCQIVETTGTYYIKIGNEVFHSINEYMRFNIQRHMPTEEKKEESHSTEAPAESKEKAEPEPESKKKAEPEFKESATPRFDVATETPEQQALREMEQFLHPSRYHNPFLASRLMQFTEETGIHVTCYKSRGYLGFQLWDAPGGKEIYAIESHKRLQAWLAKAFCTTTSPDEKKLDSDGLLILRQVEPKLLRLRGDTSPTEMDFVSDDNSQFKCRALPDARAQRHFRSFMHGVTHLDEAVDRPAAVALKEVAADVVEDAEVAGLAWVKRSNTQSTGSTAKYREIYDVAKLSELSSRMKAARPEVPGWDRQVDDLTGQQFRVFIDVDVVNNKLGQEHAGQLVTGLCHQGGEVLESKVFYAAPPVKNYDLVILLDLSGSMKGPRLTNALKAAQELFKRLPKGVRVHLTSFAAESKDHSPPMGWDPHNPDNLLAFTALTTPTSPTCLQAAGYTNTGEAWRAAARKKRPGVPLQTLFITDGEPDLGGSRELQQAGLTSLEAAVAETSRGPDSERPNVQVFYISNGKDAHGNVTYSDGATRCIDTLLKGGGPSSMSHPVTTDELEGAVQRFATYPEVRRVHLVAEIKVEGKIERFSLGWANYNEPASISFQIPERFRAQLDSLGQVEARIVTDVRDTTMVPWLTVPLTQQCVTLATITRLHLSNVMRELGELGVDPLALSHSQISDNQERYKVLLRQAYDRGLVVAVDFFNLLLIKPVTITGMRDRAGDLALVEAKSTAPEVEETDTEWLTRQKIKYEVNEQPVTDHNRVAFYNILARAHSLGRAGVVAILEGQLIRKNVGVKASSSEYAGLTTATPAFVTVATSAPRGSARVSRQYQKRNVQRSVPPSAHTGTRGSSPMDQAGMAARQEHQQMLAAATVRVQAEALAHITELITRNLPTREDQTIRVPGVPVTLDTSKATSIQHVSTYTGVAKNLGEGINATEVLAKSSYTAKAAVATIVEALLRGAKNYQVTTPFATSVFGRLFKASGGTGKKRSENLQEYILNHIPADKNPIDLLYLIYALFTYKDAFTLKCALAGCLVVPLKLTSTSPFVEIRAQIEAKIPENKLISFAAKMQAYLDDKTKVVPELPTTTAEEAHHGAYGVPDGGSAIAVTKFGITGAPPSSLSSGSSARPTLALSPALGSGLSLTPSGS
ncbi:hypothetical protein BH10PSE19_BH10PSE19_05160 [soil metagenome]